MITLCANTFFEKQIDYDTMFPSIPNENIIYVAMSGGMESVLLAYLITQHYPSHTIIPFTGVTSDRRQWEPQQCISALQDCIPSLIEHHVIANAGMTFDQANNIRLQFEEEDRTPEGYYNPENRMMAMILEVMGIDNPTQQYVFTGKNWSTMDPENINEQQQAAFRQSELSKYIIRPFLGLSKEHIISLFHHENKADWVQHTFSCIDAVSMQELITQEDGTESQVTTYMHCGGCHACWDRRQGHVMLNLTDPTTYVLEPEELPRILREEYDSHLIARQEGFA